MDSKAATVADYLNAFPPATRQKLQALRAAILEAAPGAAESISYAMPAYKLAGRPLAYFAGYGRHIGFYPTSSGIAAFKEELAGYKYAKGSVQFPLDQELPLTLVRSIVQFRAKAMSGQRS